MDTRVTMTTYRLIWWILVTMVTVTRVTCGQIVDTCTCTVRNEDCSIDRIKHPQWERSESYPLAPLDPKVVVQNTSTIHISWLPPKGASLKAVTGFFLDLNIRGQPSEFLRVSAPSKIDKDTKWALSCTMKDAVYGKELAVTIFSLPRPLPDDEKVQGAGMVVFVPLMKNMIKDNAYRWKPAVTTQATGDGKSLIIDFPFPVQLKDKIKKFRIEFKGHAELTPREVFPENNHVNSVFRIPDSLRPTCFTIRIIKLCKECTIGETYCQKTDRVGDCGTPRPISVNGSLTGTCGIMTTTPPTVSDDEITTGEMIPIYPGTTKDTRRYLDLSQRKHTDNKEDQLRSVLVPVLVIIMTLTLVAVIGIIAYRAHNKRRSAVQDSTPTCTDQSSDDAHNKHRQEPDIVTLAPDEMHEIKLVGPEKIVYIIYSDILNAHKEAVLKLAAYLEAECHCDVKIDEWEKQEMNKNIFAWPLKNYEKADKIIFIHSEDTKSKYDKYIALENKPHPTCTRKPQGDTFSRMLHKTVMDINSPNKDKYLMVRFPYTPEQCLDYAQATYCYVLPNDLDEFVLHLHGLQKYEREKTNPNYIKGINSQQYHHTDSGKNLQKAIQKATVVVKGNPNWLQDAYEEHAARAASDTAAHTQCDDNTSTTSDTLGFLGPSSLDDIPSHVENSEFQPYGRQPPSDGEGSECSVQAGDRYRRPELYAPSSTDDISITIDNGQPAVDHKLAYVKHPSIDDPAPYYDESMSTSNQFYPEDEEEKAPVQPPHGLQNIGVDPLDHIDSGFYSNDEAALLQLRQAMLQNPAGADGTLYWPQGAGIQLQEISFHPPESVSSGCSSSVDESFEQPEHREQPLDNTEHLRYLELPEFGRSSV